MRQGTCRRGHDTSAPDTLYRRPDGKTACRECMRLTNARAAERGRVASYSAVSGIATMPGFPESLRLLVERERYSIMDIGMMFNVSRERIRQLAERHGIVHPDEATGLRVVRVWDDETNTFRPRPKNTHTVHYTWYYGQWGWEYDTQPGRERTAP